MKQLAFGIRPRMKTPIPLNQRSKGAKHKGKRLMVSVMVHSAFPMRPGRIPIPDRNLRAGREKGITGKTS
jgi:hypothetical protein